MQGSSEESLIDAMEKVEQVVALEKGKRLMLRAVAGVGKRR